MKPKIITVMKFMYFIALNCLLISCYISMCNFAKDMDFEDLPATKDYAIHANTVLKREVAIAIV